MRILFLTDSLSLPRGEEEEFVAFENTYVSLLKKEFPNHLIADSAIGGATILDLYKQVFYYKHFKPDLVIIHCGIVDCAPRAWRPFGRKILQKLGLKLHGLTKFMRKYRGYKYTSPKKFDHICKKLKSEFKDVPVYAIGILPASEQYEETVPGIKSSVEQYNKLLSSNFIFIDNADFPKTGILSDFHHLTSAGHLILVNKLKTIILKELDNNN